MAPEFHQAITLERLLRYVAQKHLDQVNRLRQQESHCGSD
jgi:hypothetical protein